MAKKKSGVHAKERVFTSENHAAEVKSLKKENAGLHRQIKLIKELIALLE
jgi:hypothetical protein